MSRFGYNKKSASCETDFASRFSNPCAPSAKISLVIPSVALANQVLWCCKPKLGIEVEIVVPRQPVGVIQLAVWQGQHLRETGVAAIHFVDKSEDRRVGKMARYRRSPNHYKTIAHPRDR